MVPYGEFDGLTHPNSKRCCILNHPIHKVKTGLAQTEGSEIKSGHDRRVIAGPFQGSRCLVHFAGRAPICTWLCGHDVVNAPATVSFKRVFCSVIPECILAFILIVQAECVYKSPVVDCVEGLADFRTVANMAQESLGIVNINGFGGNI